MSEMLTDPQTATTYAELICCALGVATGDELARLTWHWATPEEAQQQLGYIHSVQQRLLGIRYDIARTLHWTRSRVAEVEGYEDQLAVIDALRESLERVRFQIENWLTDPPAVRERRKRRRAQAKFPRQSVQLAHLLHMGRPTVAGPPVELATQPAWA